MSRKLTTIKKFKISLKKEKIKEGKHAKYIVCKQRVENTVPPDLKSG